MNLRRLWRAVALGLALAQCVLSFWLARLRGPLTLERRAQWLHLSARRTLAGLSIQYQFEGQPPTQGLVVSNHLGYLDILLFLAAMPCFFVSKVEIGRWPFFGQVARAAGTIFLDRSSHASSVSVAEQIFERLKVPIPVLLFPEGASTDGTQVLHFHSRLLEPAARAGAPITAAAVRYAAEGGVEERDLCWYGDETFFANLWKVLGVDGLSGKVRFGQPKVYPDRRAAAEQTHAEVETMRAEGLAMDRRSVN